MEVDIRGLVGRALFRKFPRAVTGWRSVGCEEELPLVRPDGVMGSTDLFFAAVPSCRQALGWEPFSRDGVLAGYSHNYFGVLTVDAGIGTLEAKPSKSANMHELKLKWDRMLRLVIEAANASKQLVLGLGIQPLTPPHRDNWQPCSRYRLMRGLYAQPAHLKVPIYLSDIEGVDIATLTASSQTHVGTAFDEVLQLTTIMNALSGPFIAVAANSSVWNGKPDPKERVAVRVTLWDQCGDPTRAGMPEQPFSTMNDYLAMFLNKRLLLRTDTQNPESFVFCGLPLGDVLARNNAAPAEMVRDIMRHEGTFWYDARMRCVFGTVESRSCDQQPHCMNLALHALKLGAAENWHMLVELVRSHSWTTWRELRNAAIHRGLDAVVKPSSIDDDRTALSTRSCARMIYEAAMNGLRRRNLGEEIYLEPLTDRIFGSEPLPATHALRAYHDGGISRVVESVAFNCL